MAASCPCEADVCQELASLGAGDTCVSPAGIKDRANLQECLFVGYMEG